MVIVTHPFKSKKYSIKFFKEYVSQCVEFLKNVNQKIIPNAFYLTLYEKNYDDENTLSSNSVIIKAVFLPKKNFF